MAENQSTNSSPEDDDPSLLDGLKQAGGALGGVFSEFTGNYRADRAGVQGSTGDHALHDPVADQETTARQIRAAGAEARQKFSEGSGFGAVTDAAGSLAGHTGDIVRDVAGSVTRAADATRESDASADAVSAVSGAYSSVRGRMGEAVSSARDRLGRTRDEDDDMADEETGNIIEGEVISAETTDVPSSDVPDDKEK